MGLQSGKNILVVYKAQSGLGVPASGSGATGVRMVPSPGLQGARATINSNEVRRDGQTTKGRLGTKSSSGSYQLELSVSTLNDLIEAALRGTWAVSVDITQATMTSITTTTTTIVAAAGSWLTQGVRRGDMVKLTGHSTSANNGKWFRVTAVTATIITLANMVVGGVSTAPLTTDATPDTSFTLSVAKTLLCGATPTERYFTFEQYGQDISAGEVFTDVKITKLELSMQPNQPIVATIGVMGLGFASESGSPTFSSPTYTTTLPLVMADGTIRVNGVDYAVLTGFTLTFDNGGQAPPTLSPTAPDVFLSNARMSGQFVAMRQDMTFFDAFNNETPVDFFIHCKELEAEPADFVSFYVGNATLSGNQTQLGNDGPMPETVPWFAGKDEAGSDHALTTLKISTSV